MSDVFSQLVALLDAAGARYRVIEHEPEGRSDIVAKIRGTEPGQGAKAMVCKPRDGDGGIVLVVLPGNRKLDFRKVAAAVGAKKMTLASPEEVLQATGCVIGTVPPLALSTAVRLVADPALLAYGEVAFNAGRLDRSMVLDSKDYVRIAKPLVQDVSSE